MTVRHEGPDAGAGLVAETAVGSDATAGEAETRVEPTKLAVVKLTARTGLDQAVVDLFTDALVAELRKSPATRVVAHSDISATLGVERERQLLGCEDAVCLSEIAGALGVDRIVHGSVGRVGSSLVVYLTLVDRKRGTAVGSVSERLKSSSDEAFFDALPSIVSRLLSSSAK